LLPPSVNTESAPSAKALQLNQVTFEQWRETLFDRQREVLSHLQQGFNTVEVAKKVGCTRANISEIRRSLARKYERYCAR
jgi:DNA-binding NarL/FixJ family response regulator